MTNPTPTPETLGDIIDAALRPRKSYVFSFDGGNLTVLGEGHPEQGSGWFTFDEDEVQWRPHDEKDGCYLLANLPKSELIELRDFLNKHVTGEASST